MDIVIYDKNTSKADFNYRGYGNLTEVESYTITEELNGRYDLEMTILNSDRKIKYITKLAVVRVEGQLFRIHTIINDDIGGVVKIIANHIFYDINYGFTEDSRVKDGTVVEAMAKGLTVDFTGLFIPSSDIIEKNNVYFVKNNGVENVFSIIDRWGKGELVRDNFNYAINYSKGADNGVTFTYKKMEGIEITEDTTEIITRIYPTGKEGISLPEKYIIVPNWSEETYLPYHITREVKFSDCENEGELRVLAEKYAEEVGLSKVNFKISLHDLLNTEMYKNTPELLTVNTGDIITIKHSKLNVRVKVKCIKKVTEGITGKVSLELGQPFKTFFESVDNGKVDIPEINTDSLREKMFYYSNGDRVITGEEYKKLGYINYGVTEMSNLTLLFNMFYQCTEEGDIELKFLVDNKELYFKPKITTVKGYQCLSFSYPLLYVVENEAHSLDMFIKSSHGSITVPQFNTHVMIKGQGISGGGQERPYANVIERYDLEHTKSISLGNSSDISVSFKRPDIYSMEERYEMIEKDYNLDSKKDIVISINDIIVG